MLSRERCPPRVRIHVPGFDAVRQMIQATMGIRVLPHRAENVDVLIENLRPGALKKLDLGWDVLQALNPTLLAGWCKRGCGRRQAASEPGNTVHLSRDSNTLDLHQQAQGTSIKAPVCAAWP